MVVGESGLGKSTLINTLFNTQIFPEKRPVPPSNEMPLTVELREVSAGKIKINVAIEENGVKLTLNVIDTPGFGDFLNNETR